MTVNVKTSWGEFFDIQVKPSDTIKDFKVIIWDKTGIHPFDQRLVCAIKQLENNRILADYNI